MYLRAGVLLEELGLEFNDTNVEVLNSVGLYIVSDHRFFDSCGVVTEWYLDITIDNLKKIFFDKINKLPQNYKQIFPDRFYIHDYYTNEIKFYTNNVLLIDNSIAKLLIPWRR